ncbi:N-6 DNA methylase [Janibacter sp. UYMM211]|uniref:Eco57I restriction-modification methylase domain-containing protein n=1 Tax=Janibacter sp. UYMM211 TaxID=3156342 RepID=UPI003393D343
MSSSQTPDRALVDALDRKSRGAFFTPRQITEHLATWAIRSPRDRVLEPSAGEAAFLTSAVARLHELGCARPEVDGVEIHGPSAHLAAAAVAAVGGRAHIRTDDFFLVDPRGGYDVVIGNPPFIRYQEWTGAQRDRARFAALQQGVALSGLASSWAAFVAHSAGFLVRGGRLGLVLPAELLSVNYAAPVRRFLLENFASVELVVFDHQVFPGAEADTVLVKAEGWKQPPAQGAVLRQTRDASTLSSLGEGTPWQAVDLDERWSASPLSPTSRDALDTMTGDGDLVPLETYGDTSLGAVTGGNRFFSLSPARVRELGIPRADLIRISPPGSAHLRGLDLTEKDLVRLGRQGRSTWLLHPRRTPGAATARYIESGHTAGVDQAYKCRVRTPWWKVPVLAAPDLFLTYMNADTARLVTNSAGARHLNSVHGVYLSDELRPLAHDVLALAALNSYTVLSAELVGRSYGGGVLKIEPREADRWLMPGPALLRTHGRRLRQVAPQVRSLLADRQLAAASAVVDDILFADRDSTQAVRTDRSRLLTRRQDRGRSGKRAEGA